MSILDQFIESFLIKNKNIMHWSNQKKRYSCLYLLSISIIVSLLLVFWTVANFNTNELNNLDLYDQLELVNNQLIITNSDSEFPLKIADNITLDQDNLTYNNIHLNYQLLALIDGQDGLSWNQLVELLTTKHAVLKFILFLYTYIKALPFILFNILISFILAKLCQQLLLRKKDITYQRAYMYSCYSFTAPLFMFVVVNLATNSIFSFLWLLYLLVALNLFSIVWLDSTDDITTKSA